jgi:hypothetical protein
MTQNDARELSQLHSLPSALGPLGPDWRRIAHPDYKDIQWTYSTAPHLSCNGIKISGKTNSLTVPATLCMWGDRALIGPNLSVFDPDGHLPIQLQRTALATSRLPFESELRESVLRDFIAFVLVNAPTRHLTGRISPEAYSPRYPGFAEALRQPRWPLFACTGKGTVLVDPWFLSRASSRRLLLVPRMERAFFPSPTLRGCFDAVMIPFLGDKRHSDWLDFVSGGRRREFEPLTEINVQGRRILFQEEDYPWPKDFTDSYSARRWKVVEQGKTNDRGLDFATMIERAGSDGSILTDGLAEWYLDAKAVTTPISDIAKCWADVVGPDVVIPFDRRKRSSVLKDAFQRLAGNIDAWEHASQIARTTAERAALSSR